MLIFIIIGAIINVLLRKEILSQLIGPTVILLIFSFLFYIEVGTSNTIIDLGERSYNQWFQFNGQSITFQGAAYGLFILTIILTGLLILVSINIKRKYKIRGDESVEKETDEEENVRESISSTVEKTIRELEKNEDVYSTILNCYIEMAESIEKNSDVLYRDFMTPREFKGIITNKLDVSVEVLEDITTLFEEARYSSHILTEEDRDRAKYDLKRLKNELKTK